MLVQVSCRGAKPPVVSGIRKHLSDLPGIGLTLVGIGKKKAVHSFFHMARHPSCIGRKHRQAMRAGLAEYDGRAVESRRKNKEVAFEIKGAQLTLSLGRILVDE